MKSKTIKIICGFILLSVIAFKLGQIEKQNEFQRRAKQIQEKSFFSNMDIEHILYNTPLPNWEDYAYELKNEGWSEKAAVKIAKVEFGLLPIDQEYNAYKED